MPDVSIAKQNRTWQQMLADTETLAFGTLTPDKLAEALKATTHALRIILGGAAPQGRWLDQLTCDVCNDDAFDENELPEGYYDCEDTPEAIVHGDDHRCWSLWDEAIKGLEDYQQEDLRWDATQSCWLRPATWTDYDLEEQSAWLAACAEQATWALDIVTNILES